MFFDRIHGTIFLLAFAIGLLLCYVTKPAPEVVVKFPSPLNANTITYTDKDSQNCFKVRADKVECPFDKTLIKTQPIA
jgi:hypothetical protein